MIVYQKMKQKKYFNKTNIHIVEIQNHLDKKVKNQNININTPKVGEIDFIIVNKNKNKVFIADTKL